ncbi:MAG: hypothetical protein AAF514_08800 [Verrucomicrobiota bacterium]
MLLHLEEALSELEETTAVIILDEAQNYSQAALEENRLLLGVDLCRRPAFSLILAGDDYLLGSLKLRSQRALYSPIACHHRLDPWEREEIVQLLKQSQGAVELQDILDSEATELILNACEGLPRTALQLARAAWIQASKEKSSSIGPKHIQAVQKTIPAASNGGKPPLAT